MALKPFRDQLGWNTKYFMDETAEAGGFVVGSTYGSGAALDQGVALCTYASNPSGKVVLGCLMQDVVDVNIRSHINFYKPEVQKGSKVALQDKGSVETNMIYPGVTPTGGASAYLGPSGLLITTSGPGNPYVGYFESTKDEDGYASVRFNLP